jgi:putative transposase
VGGDTMSRITGKVVEEMIPWCYHPLEEIYPVLFIDAIVTKVREGQPPYRSSK